MRLAGGVLLVAAGVLAGLCAAYETTHKAKILYSLLTALETVRAELVTCLTAFPEIFARLAQIQGTVGMFFGEVGMSEEKLLRERWEEALRRHLYMLPGDSLDTLYRLGTQLGHSMADEQLRFLEEAVRQLQRQYEREERQAQERGVLYRRICPAVAAAVALMLI